MASGRVGKSLIGPLLAVNFVVYLILLGLAGWSLDKYIDGEQDHPHLGGNPSTTFLLTFALIGGMIGACSLFAGLMHLRAWHGSTLASASSSAFISWAVTALAFGYPHFFLIPSTHISFSCTEYELHPSLHFNEISCFLSLDILVQSGMQADHPGRTQRETFANIGSFYHNFNTEPVAIPTATACWHV